MTRRLPAILAAGAVLAACGGKRSTTLPTTTAATPATASVDSLWRLAESAFRRGKWTEAQGHFERVAASLPSTDGRYQRLHFYLGESLYGQGQHLLAVREFRRVSDERPEDALAPDALVRAGDAYADLWRRPELDPTYGENARSVYQEVLARYPGTPAAGRAVIRLAALAEKFAYKEYKNALFYYRYKAYDSAVLLLRGLLAEYPRTTIAPSALEKLVQAYRTLGYAEDLRETCAYIAEYHPDPAGPRRLCPRPAADSATGTGNR
ncbi:MAG: outer membrane protein assembly factor BamD [Gemmatimonadales bacterium]